ncbi:MAG TPA: hypothetical protein PKO06_19730 [Candidatus Ozemobacteraceae bacterium]|nr:hypothetical protein [Candidatus Ozemobacteraceae bacterium]
MRSSVPEKILLIADQIEEDGSVNITKLTIVKKWFAKPQRRKAFALWMARHAAGKPGKVDANAKRILNDAKKLLGSAPRHGTLSTEIDREKIGALCDRARAFNDEYVPGKWGSVRIIQCQALLLIEKSLAILLVRESLPAEAYELLATWVYSFDSRYSDTLNGPSSGRLREFVRFMFTVEALEHDAEANA